MRSLILLCFLFLTLHVFGQDSSSKSMLGTIRIRKPADPPPADSIYLTSETKPRFKGGNKGLTKFMYKNLNLPAQAFDSVSWGRVVISFVVEKDGSLKDIRITESASPAMDFEAIRVFNLMPSWEPGLRNGKPVAVRLRMPIEFGIPPDPVNSIPSTAVKSKQE